MIHIQLYLLLFVHLYSVNIDSSILIIYFENILIIYNPLFFINLIYYTHEDIININKLTE